LIGCVLHSRVRARSHLRSGCCREPSRLQHCAHPGAHRILLYGAGIEYRESPSWTQTLGAAQIGGLDINDREPRLHRADVNSYGVVAANCASRGMVGGRAVGGWRPQRFRVGTRLPHGCGTCPRFAACLASWLHEAATGRDSGNPQHPSGDLNRIRLADQTGVRDPMESQVTAVPDTRTLGPPGAPPSLTEPLWRRLSCAVFSRWSR